KGVYQVTAEALPASSDSAKLRVTLSYPGGSVQGVVTDQSFKIGKEEIKLSALRSLRFAPKATAVLVKDKTVTGELTGLEGLSVELGTDTVKLNPAKALELTVPPKVEETSVACTVVVREGDKEVARVRHTLSFRDVPAAIAKNGEGSPADDGKRLEGLWVLEE